MSRIPPRHPQNAPPSQEKEERETREREKKGHQEDTRAGERRRRARRTGQVTVRSAAHCWVQAQACARSVPLPAAQDWEMTAEIVRLQRVDMVDIHSTAKKMSEQLDDKRCKEKEKGGP